MLLIGFPALLLFHVDYMCLGIQNDSEMFRANGAFTTEIRRMMMSLMSLALAAGRLEVPEVHRTCFGVWPRHQPVLDARLTHPRMFHSRLSFTLIS